MWSVAAYRADMHGAFERVRFERGGHLVIYIEQATILNNTSGFQSTAREHGSIIIRGPTNL
jgi:hypothetical protein